jgi:hypothetical protein
VCWHCLASLEARRGIIAADQGDPKFAGVLEDHTTKPAAMDQERRVVKIDDVSLRLTKSNLRPALYLFLAASPFMFFHGIYCLPLKIGILLITFSRLNCNFPSGSGVG